MSKQYTFEKELLKNLVSLYLTNGCNFESNFPEEFKKPIKLFFYDTIPMV
jgi:hypothetical protein